MMPSNERVAAAFEPELTKGTQFQKQYFCAPFAGQHGSWSDCIQSLLKITFEIADIFNSD